MNSINLVGRLTQEPKLEKTANGTNFVRGCLAISRSYKDDKGEKPTDFIPFIAWRVQADYLAKYAAKGSRISLSGTLQSSSYEKDGQKRVSLSAIARELNILDSNNNKSTATISNVEQQRQAVKKQATNQITEDDSEFFVPVDDAQLPFSL